MKCSTQPFHRILDKLSTIPCPCTHLSLVYQFRTCTRPLRGSVRMLLSCRTCMRPKNTDAVTKVYRIFKKVRRISPPYEWVRCGPRQRCRSSVSDCRTSGKAGDAGYACGTACIACMHETAGLTMAPCQKELRFCKENVLLQSATWQNTPPLNMLQPKR